MDTLTIRGELIMEIDRAVMFLLELIEPFMDKRETVPAAPFMNHQ